MSTSNSEMNTSSASQPKRINEPIYTYAISWGWLIVGLVCTFVFFGGTSAAYLLQTRNLSRRIVEVANNMIEGAEQATAKAELEDDIAAKKVLWRESLQLRNDAANLLDRYRRSNSRENNVAVLEKLYEILESLYHDHGENSTEVGAQRGEQLSALASELARSADESGSIKYLTRLLKLEWDRKNFMGIINGGKDLLRASQSLREPINYDARRYIAMALFDNLPLQPYDTNEYQLPPVFKESMDELLESLNSENPGDIDIAKRYAEFLVRVGRQGDANYTDSASVQLRDKSDVERLALARNRIDEIVLRNPEDSAAYLARYHFLSKFTPSGLDLASPDLQKVLELSPNGNEGLILSALHALRNAGIAAQSDDHERAQEWQNMAEGYFRRSVKENPGDPYGYQYLGEYLLRNKRDYRETINVWSEGLKNAGNRSGNEELIGRLVMLLLQQGMIPEAKGRLLELARTIDEMRINFTQAEIQRVRNIENLLQARLAREEANIALARIEAAGRENRPGDAQRYYGIVQQKRGDAVQRFERVLLDFGKTEEDYIIERQSVYFSLLPQSLIQLAQLKLETNEWDKAAEYFDKARRFNDVLKQALIGMSAALQQGNRLAQAVAILSEAAARFPDDSSIQYAYTMVSFRSQVTSNTATTESLDDVRKKLEALESFRNELPQPWILDIRLIHLEYARANLSNQADTILEAMNTAVRKFRALEKQTFPPDAEGNARNYIDDPAFVAELVGIYSSLAARTDFDRLLEILRAFPEGGEDAYYTARINDADRRGSRNEVIEIFDEAIESSRLSQARKDQFVALLQNLRGENVENASQLDKFYEQLKTTFDESPESLKPQAFFMLAKLALEREDAAYVRQVRDRLEKIEGQGGSRWRWIDVRLMLAEEDPDYDKMRQIHEEIVRLRPEWDEAYVLGAMIEEKYYALNPGNTIVRDNLIAAYRNAIDRGNLQPEVWQRLILHLESAGRTEDARLVSRDAALRGVMVDRAGQLPQPYNRMYSQIQTAIENEDAAGADAIARQCIRLAEMQGSNPELLAILHLMLGQVFLDADMFESALRHLSITAQRGGKHVFPLALCLARSGDIDGGFSLLLDEITLVPSSMPELLPTVLLLLTRLQPSEAIYERIDRLMDRLEKGERLPVRGATITPSGEDRSIPIETKWVAPRQVRSMVVRFPEKTDDLDPSTIQFIAPTESSEEEEPVEKPVEKPVENPVEKPVEESGQ